jgi:hypothetical protein
LPVHHNAHKRPSNNKHLEQSKSEDTEDRSDTDLTHSADESDVSNVKDLKSIVKTLSTEVIVFFFTLKFLKSDIYIQVPMVVTGSKAKKSLGLPVSFQTCDLSISDAEIKTLLQGL